ncbi:hypothetical protein DACRYDRAFT_105990 [Dacryopinax primogenitus]|uniref:Uncharacterized protein n=1 Tax=Dacryopinax primogenitus (strain DJM 731) TaxID=1858805 RepID=M5GF47_DACPD|nr:uncharacterized protein DACRYDRAFT_105990 [Dacryopinax primogenitus]EJU03833.1 hypothetical protein DACRYDRAFT_105990 [Dacryopinax primogenitus]
MERHSTCTLNVQGGGRPAQEPRGHGSPVKLRDSRVCTSPTSRATVVQNRERLERTIVAVYQIQAYLSMFRATYSAPSSYKWALSGICTSWLELHGTFSAPSLLERHTSARYYLCSLLKDNTRRPTLADSGDGKPAEVRSKKLFVRRREHIG